MRHLGSKMTPPTDVLSDKKHGGTHIFERFTTISLSLSLSLSLIHECTTNLAPFVSERSSKRNNSDSKLSSDAGDQ